MALLPIRAFEAVPAASAWYFHSMAAAYFSNRYMKRAEIKTSMKSKLSECVKLSVSRLRESKTPEVSNQIIWPHPFIRPQFAFERAKSVNFFKGDLNYMQKRDEAAQCQPFDNSPEIDW